LLPRHAKLIGYQVAQWLAIHIDCLSDPNADYFHVTIGDEQAARFVFHLSSYTNGTAPLFGYVCMSLGIA